LKKNPDKNLHAFLGARKHDRANSAKADSTLKSKKIKSHKNFKNINICFDFSASETFFIFYRNTIQQKLKYEKNFRQKKISTIKLKASTIRLYIDHITKNNCDYLLFFKKNVKKSPKKYFLC
jgi:hypothetical protein